MVGIILEHVDCVVQVNKGVNKRVIDGENIHFTRVKKAQYSQLCFFLTFTFVSQEYCWHCRGKCSYLLTGEEQRVCFAVILYGNLKFLDAKPRTQHQISLVVPINLGEFFSS